MENLIFLQDVTMSFPHWVEPQTSKTDDGKDRVSYNGDFIMLPNHPGFLKFMEMFHKLFQEKFKEHAASAINMVTNDRKSRCFGQGAEKISKKTFAPYPEYVGNVFITAGNKNRPQMIMENGKPAEGDLQILHYARKLYAGCKVNAVVKPWVQENNKGIGIRCDPIAVQFAGVGTPIGEGHVDASGMFGAVTVAAPVAQPQMPQLPFGAIQPQPMSQPSGIPNFLFGGK